MEKEIKQKRQLHMEQGIQIVVQILLALFLAFVFIRGFAQVEIAGRYVSLAVAGAFCFLLLFFYGMGRLFKALPDSVLKKVFVGQCIIVAALQLFFLFYYRSMYLWDGAFVVGGANSLLEEGKVAGEAFYYLSVYPNQNGFVLLTMALLKIGKCLGLGNGNLILLLNGANLTAIDVSLLFTLLIIKKLHPRLFTYQWNLLLLFLGCNPFFYVAVSYYYTMTLSLPWFMGFIYFFISMVKGKEERGKRQICRAVAAGICFSAGYYLRATTIIPFLGSIVCGILLLWANRKKLSKRAIYGYMGQGCIALLTALFLVSSFRALGTSIVGIDTEDTAFPATHWLMMSLSGEGFHNGEDEAFTASFPTKEEKKQAVMERLKERLKELGITGYIRQAGKKTEHTFAGGANSYKMFYENALRTDKGYSYLLGEKSQGFLIYAQAYHLIVLFFIVLSFAKRFRWETFFLQITLLGGFLFYVLWEAAAQYQIPFLMIMALLAASGGKKGMELIETKKIGRIMPWAGLTGVLMLGAFLGTNYGAFTKTEQEISHPVVTQTLANEPLAIKDSFSQSFCVSDPFNYILFQWRNPIGDDNDSVYRITLTGKSSGIMFSELLDSKGTPYQGGFEKKFDMVYPQGRENFLLQIEKVKGSSESYLEFVTYFMGGYDSYPYGSCFLEEGRDLTFLVAAKETASLFSAEEYVFFSLAFFLLFLFLVFCCKIKGNVNRKDLSYGS